MTWANVNDSQIPNWGGTPFDLITAFQADAFQFTPLAFQIGGVVFGWGAINTYENPDWEIVNPASAGT